MISWSSLSLIQSQPWPWPTLSETAICCVEVLTLVSVLTTVEWPATANGKSQKAKVLSPHTARGGGLAVLPARPLGATQSVVLRRPSW